MGKADQILAMAALEKRQRGERPTREEAAALRRYQQDLDRQQREQAYAAVPKRYWRTWSGRQHKVILEQADRYGFPMLRGAAIDLPTFARRFHDFLAENARKLVAGDNDDASLAGVASPALEKKRQIECRRLELKLACDEGQWIERSLIHEGHNRIGGVLQTAGEALLRQFGPAAQKILNDALDNCQREIDRLLDPDGDTSSDQCGAE